MTEVFCHICRCQDNRPLPHTIEKIANEIHEVVKS